MAASIQMAVTAKTGIVAPGTTPSTRKHPGAVANPIVRSSSPAVDRVCGPGMTLTPMPKVMSAQAAHMSNAIALTTATVGSVCAPISRTPTPAATLDRMTVAPA